VRLLAEKQVEEDPDGAGAHVICVGVGGLQQLCHVPGLDFISAPTDILHGPFRMTGVATLLGRQLRRTGE
jgi:hypothetical protein